MANLELITDAQAELVNGGRRSREISLQRSTNIIKDNTFTNSGDTWFVGSAIFLSLSLG